MPCCSNVMCTCSFFLSACRKFCKFQMIRLESELCCTAFIWRNLITGCFKKKIDNWFEFLHWNLNVSSCVPFSWLHGFSFLIVTTFVSIFSSKCLVKPRQWPGLFFVISPSQQQRILHPIWLAVNTLFCRGFNMRWAYENNRNNCVSLCYLLAPQNLKLLLVAMLSDCRGV